MLLSFSPRCWCFYLFVSIPSLPSYWWILSVLSVCMIIENIFCVALFHYLSLLFYHPLVGECGQEIGIEDSGT